MIKGAILAKKMVLQDFGDNPAVNLPVHRECCERCPSAKGQPDEFTKDFMKLPLDLRRMTVFPCAWRPNKLCKGYYDLMERGE